MLTGPPLLFVDVAGVLNPYAVLAAVLDLPTFCGAVTLPVGELDPGEKVPAVASVAGDRPVAWIDDQLSGAAWDWARRRHAPTLLVAIDSAVGLTRAETDTLLRWGRQGHPVE